MEDEREKQKSDVKSAKPKTESESFDSSNRGAEEDLRRTKKLLNDSRDALAEHIEQCKGLWVSLVRSEQMISHQLDQIAQGTSMPSLYSEATSAIYSSGSYFSDELRHTLGSQAPAFESLTEKATLLHGAVTTSTAMATMTISHSIQFGDCSPDADPDWEGLEGRLKCLVPDAAKKLAGAQSAMSNPGAEAPSQACHSIRECFTLVIHHLAPDDNVMATEWFEADPTSGNGITRKHRLLYMLLGDKGPKSEIEDADMALISTTLRLNADVIGMAHDHKEITRAQVLPVMTSFCSSLVALLDKYEAIWGSPGAL